MHFLNIHNLHFQLEKERKKITLEILEGPGEATFVVGGVTGYGTNGQMALEGFL